MGHVTAGLLICLLAIGATAVVAATRPVPPAPGAPASHHPLLRALVPAMVSATALAAMRIWNAPASAARTRALSLWGALQGLNLLWLLLRPKDKVTQVLAALSTAGMTAACAHAAAKVDEKAANIVAPTGFAGLSALVARP